MLICKRQLAELEKEIKASCLQHHSQPCGSLESLPLTLQSGVAALESVLISTICDAFGLQHLDLLPVHFASHPLSVPQYLPPNPSPCSQGYTPPNSHTPQVSVTQSHGQSRVPLVLWACSLARGASLLASALMALALSAHTLTVHLNMYNVSASWCSKAGQDTPGGCIRHWLASLVHADASDLGLVTPSKRHLPLAGKPVIFYCYPGAGNWQS